MGWRNAPKTIHFSQKETPLENQDSVANTERATVSPLATLGLVIGLLAYVFRAFVWSRGQLNGEATGYAVGGVLVAFLIAYAFAGRKKVRNRNKFSLVFLITSVLELLLELSTRHTTN
jgi:hypothetical protein